MDLPVDGDVKHWGIPKVAGWLTKNGMDIYVNDFRDSYIDGEKLLSIITQGKLRELNVHPRHTEQILQAIENYKFHNPDNPYEINSDEDIDDFDNDDETDGYTGPDDVIKARIQASQSQSFRPPLPKPFRAPPPPPPEEEERIPSYTSEEEYVEPDVLPPPSKPPPSKHSHRPLPTAPGEEGPPPPARPSKGVQLTSMPESQAPGPPKIPGQRQRPPAAMPSSNHISTKPVVPFSQSLDPPVARPPISRISPPKPSTPEQETYEIVDSGEPSPMNPPAPPPKLGEPVPRVGRHGPLPLPPGADDDSGGSISPGQKPPFSTSPRSVTLKPVKTPAPAPAPSPAPSEQKKKLASYSYNDHSLPNGDRKVQTLPKLPEPRSTPSAVTPAAKPIKPAVTLPVKPAVTLPVKPAVASAKPVMPAASTADPIDTSGLSIKERAKLINQRSEAQLLGGLKPPEPKSRQDLTQQMQEKIQQRRQAVESTPASVPERDAPQLPVSPRPVANPPANSPSPNKQAPPLPPGRRGQAGGAHPTPFQPAVVSETPPMLPTSERPRLDSLSSNASNSTGRSMDDDRGLYNYTWYKSDISRVNAANLLQKKHHDGAFLVRKSTQGPKKPYTLDVIYNSSEFHIPIRHRDDGDFAIGAPKPEERHWPTVAALIAYFKSNMLNLTKTVPGSSKPLTYSTLLRE